MDWSIVRRVAVLLVMCFISLATASRTSGFDNIRAVQFLLIFAAGALAGVALALLREARRSRPVS